MLLTLLQFIFVGATAAAVNLPPRYYYPAATLTDAARAKCNAEADTAFAVTMKESGDPGLARIREVNAFEACAKR